MEFKAEFKEPAPQKLEAKEDKYVQTKDNKSTEISSSGVNSLSIVAEPKFPKLEFLKAIKKNNLNYIKSCFDRDAKYFDVKTNNNRSFIFSAISSGIIDIFKESISRKLDLLNEISPSDSSINTLQYAIKCEKYEIIAEIVNIIEKNTNDPVITGLINYHNPANDDDATIFHTLIANNSKILGDILSISNLAVNLDKTNNNQQTPLLYACRILENRANKNNHLVSDIDLLITKSSKDNINSVDCFNRDAAFYLIAKNQDELFLKLIENGYEIKPDRIFQYELSSSLNVKKEETTGNITKLIHDTKKHHLEENSLMKENDFDAPSTVTKALSTDKAFVVNAKLEQGKY